MKYQLGTLEWSVRTRPARTSSDALAIGANIAIRAVLVVVVLFSLWTRPIMDSDVRRFSALSVEAGTPYRDHAVEYAPVELGVIRLIGSGDARATATRLVLVCFLLAPCFRRDVEGMGPPYRYRLPLARGSVARLGVSQDMGRVHHFCDPPPDGIPVGFRDQHPSTPAR
jgi:hypothetical protein